MLSNEQQEYINTLKQRYPDVPEATLRSTLEGAHWSPESVEEGVGKYFGKPTASVSSATSAPVPADASPSLAPAPSSSVAPPAASRAPLPINQNDRALDQGFAKKAPSPLPIIAFAAVAVLVIGGAVFALSGKKEEKTEAVAVAPTQAPAKPVATSQPQQTNPNQPTAPQQGLVGVTYKDSILRSIDGGDTFETYFAIATTTLAGQADVLSVSFHPKTKDRIVVTTNKDGLFLNQDRENKWLPVPFPPKQIYSFILDARDPDHRAFASGVVSGNGRIFRTQDGGGTWKPVYAEPGLNTYVSALIQDPRNSDLMLAGTNAGTVVRSLDGGATWSNIGNAISGLVSRFTFDAGASPYVYMLLYQGKVYHSSDRGVKWVNWEEQKELDVKNLEKQADQAGKDGNKDLQKQLRAQADALRERNKTDKEPSGIVFIVADPRRTGTVYAGTTKGIYRSTDYGKYWKSLNIIESALNFPIPAIAINPKNSDEISFVAGKTYYRSRNAGETWAIIPLDNSRNASFVAYDPFDPKVILIGMSAVQ